MELKTTNGIKHYTSTPDVSQKSGRNDDARLAKAAKDFESLITSMMLKSMFKGNEETSDENNFGGDYFDMIFSNEIASKISESKGLGIADVIYKKITGKSLPDNSVKIKLNNLQDLPLKNIDSGLRSLQPGKRSLERLHKYEPYIEEASEMYGISKNIIRSVILTESAANEKAVSKANAKGLMQLIDSTAADMGVNNVWNPRENIIGGTKYLAQMLRLYDGDLKLALASYNAGPGNVQKYKGVPPFEETKNYITRVMSYMNHLNEKNNEA